MITRKITLVLLFVLFCAVQGNASIKYQFTFANDTNKNGKVFTSNGAHITVSDIDTYVEIQEITSGPNTRLKSGMIQLDFNNNVDFDTHLNFASWTYYIGMAIYINYINESYQAFFSMFINLRSSSAAQNETLWVCYLDSSSTNTTFYSEYCGTSTCEGKKLTVPVKFYGWQYIGCITQNTSPGVSSHYVKIYNSSGDMNIFELTDPITENSYSLQGASIGCVNILSRHNFISGLIQYLDICNDTTSCKSFPSSRATFLKDQLNLYEHYWDFTQNNGFDYLNIVNPCLRNRELRLSDLNFVTVPGTPSVYPTQRGWFTLSNQSYVNSGPVSFSDSHQMSIQFEIFISTPTFSFAVKPLGTSSNSNPIEFWFNERYSAVINPSLSTSGVRLQSFSWNQVTISLCEYKNTNMMTIFMFNKVLGSSSANADVIGSFMYHLNSLSYQLKGSSLKFTIFRSEPAIIKNFKFFKWTINFQTLLDMGIYKDSGSDSFNFESNYNSLYYQHFYSSTLIVPDAVNPCKTYLGSDQNVCRDLTKKIVESCSSEFEPLSLFCVDKCGDGIVQMSSQMMQCDDGNNKDGDGCSSICIIEDKFECEVMTNLNIIYNKSYCRRKCGNAKWVDADSEQCDDGNENDGDGCSKLCTIEIGFKCQNTANIESLCYQNCGDKIRDTIPYVEECDDGNNSSYDGCSKDCKVEFNYVCSPSPGKGDVCTTIYPKPKILNAVFDANLGQISVLFDQTMLSQNITSNDILVDAFGPNEPYIISWSASFQNSTFVVKFSTVPGIIGGYNEAIDLQLLNVYKFKSSHAIAMMSPVRYVFRYPTPDPNKSAESTSKGASYTFVFSFLISIGVSLLTGGSMELMWSLANTLQIMFFYGTLDLYLSTDLKSLFSFMRYSNFDNPVTDYISNLFVNGINFVKIPVSSNFSDLGFQSTNIISNSFLKILTILAVIFGGIFLSIMFTICPENNFCLIRLMRKLDAQMRYETMTRIFVETMLNLSVSSLINLTFGSLDNSVEIVSYVVALIVMMLILFVIGYSFVYPFMFHKRIVTHPDFNERHCFLFLEFKRERLSCLMFYGYFILHRLMLTVVFVCMNSFPTHQCALLLYFNLLMLVYLLIFKPFKSQLQNYLNCFNGFIMLVFSLTMFMFLSSTGATRIIICSYMCIGIVLIFIVVNWAIIFPITTIMAIKNIKERCHKKTEQEIEDENNVKTIRHVTHLSARGKLII